MCVCLSKAKFFATFICSLHILTLFSLFFCNWKIAQTFKTWTLNLRHKFFLALCCLAELPNIFFFFARNRRWTVGTKSEGETIMQKPTAICYDFSQTGKRFLEKKTRNKLNKLTTGLIPGHPILNGVFFLLFLLLLPNPTTIFWRFSK